MGKNAQWQNAFAEGVDISFVNKSMSIKHHGEFLFLTNEGGVKHTPLPQYSFRN